VKKVLYIILALCLLLGVVCGCSSSKETKDNSVKEEVFESTELVSEEEDSGTAPLQSEDWVPNNSYGKSFYELMGIIIDTMDSCDIVSSPYKINPDVAKYMGIREDGLAEIGDDALRVYERAVVVLEDIVTMEGLIEEYPWWVDEVEDLDNAITVLSFSIEEHCKLDTNAYLDNVMDNVDRLTESILRCEYYVSNGYYAEDMHHGNVSNVFEMLTIADVMLYPIYGEYMFGIANEVYYPRCDVLMNQWDVIKEFPELYPEFAQAQEEAAQRQAAAQEERKRLEEEKARQEAEIQQKKQNVIDAAGQWYEEAYFLSNTGVPCKITDIGEGGYAFEMWGVRRIAFDPWSVDVNSVELNNNPPYIPYAATDESYLLYAPEQDIFELYHQDNRALYNFSGVYHRITQEEYENYDVFRQEYTEDGWICNPLEKWYLSYEPLYMQELYCEARGEIVDLKQTGDHSFRIGLNYMSHDPMYNRRLELDFQDSDAVMENGCLVYQGSEHILRYEYATRTLYVEYTGFPEFEKYSGIYTSEWIY